MLRKEAGEMKTFETYHNEHEEMQEFFRHLYHDKKNGQVIQLRKDGKKATQHSVFDVSESMEKSDRSICASLS